MKTALYARVSTADQDCSMQMRELRDYTGRQEWQVFQEYVDNGVSGTKAVRPALGRLMADARLKRFDAILVWKIDRFGRSLTQLIDNVRILDSYGVQFIAVTQESTRINAPRAVACCFTSSLAWPNSSAKRFWSAFAPVSQRRRRRVSTADGQSASSAAMK